MFYYRIKVFDGAIENQFCTHARRHKIRQPSRGESIFYTYSANGISIHIEIYTKLNDTFYS